LSLFKAEDFFVRGKPPVGGQGALKKGANREKVIHPAAAAAGKPDFIAAFLPKQGQGQLGVREIFGRRIAQHPVWGVFFKKEQAVPA
jgi:hypothetical protein